MDPGHTGLGYDQESTNSKSEMMKTILLMRARTLEVDGAMGIGVESPVWEHVEDCVRRAYAFGGAVTLTAGYPETDTRIRHGVSINMSAHPQQCRLTYLPIEKLGEKTKLMEWWEPLDKPFRGTTVFHDHPFDDRTVCRDVDAAVRIFKDFFNNHDLTDSSLVDFLSVWDAKER